nr:MAG TPA: hypothetical protein [Caudoviricetes sp.]
MQKLLWSPCFFMTSLRYNILIRNSIQIGAISYVDFS